VGVNRVFAIVAAIFTLFGAGLVAIGAAAAPGEDRFVTQTARAEGVVLSRADCGRDYCAFGIAFRDRQGRRHVEAIKGSAFINTGTTEVVLYRPHAPTDAKSATDAKNTQNEMIGFGSIFLFVAALSGSIAWLRTWRDRRRQRIIIAFARVLPLVC